MNALSEQYKNAIRHALRRHVGSESNKVMEVSALAAALGEPRRNVYAWIGGQCSPNGPKLVAMFHLLGSDFTNDVLSASGLGGAHRVTLNAVHPVTYLTRLTDLHGATLKALEDYRIDHVESAILAPKARAVASMSAEFSAALRTGSLINGKAA